MKKILILVIAALFINNAIACTTAIISGKFTKDGRPILWKLRDTDNSKNKMKYFTDGKYNYIGLINSADINGEQVWGGSNSTGFSIMNSASYNVNLSDTSHKKDMEGYFMKLALQSCSSVDEFEELIKSYPKPMGLAANFGVIDAKGGAAYYEVNNYTYTKFDANDSRIAPNGYIIRTNFSFTGKKDIGYGFIRFQTAESIFHQADSEQKLNYKTIIQQFSRCLKHSVLNKDYREKYSKLPNNNSYINSDDFITRYSSASSIVVHGVKKGESSDFTTIWSLVGFPNTCIAIPAWVMCKNNLPRIITANSTNNAPLNTLALKLKERCFPIKRAAGYKYLQVSKLINTEHSGIIQKIEPMENKIFDATEQKLKIWRQKHPSKNEIVDFYEWISNFIEKGYSENFGI